MEAMDYKPKFLDRDPPLLIQTTENEKQLIDYLAYMKEQINFILSYMGKRLTLAGDNISELDQDVNGITLSNLGVKCYEVSKETTSQYFIHYDSDVTTNSKIFVQNKYISSIGRTDLVLTAQPQNGYFVVYCRSHNGTIADGTQVDAFVMIVN